MGKRFIEKSAKTVQDAIALALVALDLELDNAKIEVLDEGKPSFFGRLANRMAKVRVTAIDEDDEDLPQQSDNSESDDYEQTGSKASSRRRSPRDVGSDGYNRDSGDGHDDREDDNYYRDNDDRDDDYDDDDDIDSEYSDDNDDNDDNDDDRDDRYDEYGNERYVSDKNRNSRYDDNNGGRSFRSHYDGGGDDGDDDGEGDDNEDKNNAADNSEDYTEDYAEGYTEDYTEDSNSLNSPYISDKEKIIHFLNGIFKGINIDVNMNVEKNDDGYNVNVKSEDSGILIGHRGETLEAMQYLTNLCVNRGKDEFVRVTVDIEGYRKKREETLIRLAGNVSEKVIKMRRNITLEPMNSYERRVIHSTLQNHPRVETYSVGEDPNRKVVVTLKNWSGGQSYGDGGHRYKR